MYWFKRIDNFDGSGLTASFRNDSMRPLDPLPHDIFLMFFSLVTNSDWYCRRAARWIWILSTWNFGPMLFFDTKAARQKKMLRIKNAENKKCYLDISSS